MSKYLDCLLSLSMTTSSSCETDISSRGQRTTSDRSDFSHYGSKEQTERSRRNFQVCNRLLNRKLSKVSQLQVHCFNIKLLIILYKCTQDCWRLRLLSLLISCRDDDDINDVASMAGVNLSEESARILATNSEIVGMVTRSCKDEAFLSTHSLTRIVLEIGEWGVDSWENVWHVLAVGRHCLNLYPHLLLLSQVRSLVSVSWAQMSSTSSPMLHSSDCKTCWKKYPRWHSRRT